MRHAFYLWNTTMELLAMLGTGTYLLYLKTRMSVELKRCPLKTGTVCRYWNICSQFAGTQWPIKNVERHVLLMERKILFSYLQLLLPHNFPLFIQGFLGGHHQYDPFTRRRFLTIKYDMPYSGLKFLVRSNLVMISYNAIPYNMSALTI